VRSQRVSRLGESNTLSEADARRRFVGRSCGLRGRGLDDADVGASRGDSHELEPGRLEQRGVFARRALLTARHFESELVAENAGNRRAQLVGARAAERQRLAEIEMASRLETAAASGSSSAGLRDEITISCPAAAQWRASAPPM
jgi:hypothetical protein